MASKAYKLKLFFPKGSNKLRKELWHKHKEVNQLAREYELLLLIFRGESLRMRAHPEFRVHLGDDTAKSDADKNAIVRSHSPLAYGIHSGIGVQNSINYDLLRCLTDIKPQVQNEMGKTLDNNTIVTDSTKVLYFYGADEIKDAGLKFVRLNQKRIAELNLEEYQKTAKANAKEIDTAREAQNRMEIDNETARGTDEDILKLLKAYHDFILPEAVLGDDGNLDPNAKGKPANSFGGEPSFLYNFSSEAGTKAYIGDETYATLEKIIATLDAGKTEKLDDEGKSLKPKQFTISAEALEKAGSIMNKGDFHMGVDTLINNRTGNTPGWLKDPYFTQWYEGYNQGRLMPQNMAQVEWIYTFYSKQKEQHKLKVELDRGRLQELCIVPCLNNTAGSVPMKMSLIVAIEHMKAWTTWVDKAEKSLKGASDLIEKGVDFIKKQNHGQKALDDIGNYEEEYTQTQSKASGNQAKENFIMNTGTIKQWQLVVEGLYGIEIGRVKARNDNQPWSDDVLESRRESAIKLVQQKNKNFGDFPFFQFIARVGNEYLWQQDIFMDDVKDAEKPKTFLWRSINKDTTSLACPDDQNQVPLFVLVATTGMWKLEKRRTRDFALYTPPNHIFNPQWSRYESSGSNYDTYEFHGNLKGRRMYEISLGNMGKPPKQKKSKKDDIPTVGDTYPKIHAIRTTHFDGFDITTAGKKVKVEFNSNYKQFSGELGGGKIVYDRHLLERMEMERIRANNRANNRNTANANANDNDNDTLNNEKIPSPDKAMGGPAFISMTVDVTPIIANGIQKEIVRNHGTGNENITKALSVGDNILSIDLGVRTFASCSVFEITDKEPTHERAGNSTLWFPIPDRKKDNLYAVKVRSFPLNMPGEGSIVAGATHSDAKRAENIRNNQYNIIGFFKGHIGFIKSVNPHTSRKEDAPDTISDMSRHFSANLDANTNVSEEMQNIGSVADQVALLKKHYPSVPESLASILPQETANYMDVCHRVYSNILHSIKTNIANNPTMVGLSDVKEGKQLDLHDMRFLPESEADSIRRKGMVELRKSFSTLIYAWYKIQRTSKATKYGSRKVVWGKTASAIDYYDRVFQLLKSWQNLGKVDMNRGMETAERTGRFLRTFKDHILSLRDDRVKVGSDLIIRAALGYRPVKSAGNSVEKDLQTGQKIGWELVDGAKTCKLILFEDLASYRTSFSSDRQGNRTLMTWSHRAIVETVEKAADAYKMRVISVNADYTSQFYSENGAPGVRGFAIGRHSGRNKNDQKYAPTMLQNHLLKNISESKSAEMQELFRMGTHEDRITGFVIKAGGPDFLSVAYDENGNKVLQVVNADENAATNLQTRYLKWDKSWNKMLVKSSPDSKYCENAVKKNSNMFMISFHKNLEHEFGKNYQFKRLGNSDITFQVVSAQGEANLLNTEEVREDQAVVDELMELSTKKNSSVVAKGTFNLFRDPSGILFNKDYYYTAQKGIFWTMVRNRLNKLATPFTQNGRNGNGITLYDYKAMERETKKLQK